MRLINTPALTFFLFSSIFAPGISFAQDVSEDQEALEDESEEELDEASDAQEETVAEEAAPTEDETSTAAPAETAAAATDAAPVDDGDDEIEIEEEDVVEEGEPAENSTAKSGPPADSALSDEAAAAALADAPSKEASLSPVKFTTSTWSRFEWRENYDDLGVSRARFQEGDFVVFRARLGLQTNPLAIGDESDVLVQFTPQASGMYGINGSIGEANVGIFEGYFKIRTKRLDLQVGRQQIHYGDDLVIGTLDWHQTGRAFDGIRGHYKMNHGYLDVFATQVAEGFPGGGPKFLGGDDYFWGAYLGVGEYLRQGMALDVYFLGQSDVRQEGRVDAVSGASYDLEGANLFTAGARVKDKIGFFDYRLEAGLQFGNTRKAPAAGYSGGTVQHQDALAYQADAEVGVTFAGQTRLALNGLIASGDDPTTSKNEGWNQLYPTGHKFLGLMDVVGDRTNVASGNLKFSRAITSSLTGLLDAHVFYRLQRGGVGSTGAGFAGSEIDAQLRQKLGKYAQLRGLYGVFIPKTGAYQADGVAHYVEIQAGVDF